MEVWVIVCFLGLLIFYRILDFDFCFENEVGFWGSVGVISIMFYFYKCSCFSGSDEYIY